MRMSISPTIEAKMAEPKTRPTDVDPKAYLTAIEDERRRSDALYLLALYCELTGEPAVMWGPSIIGFGQYMAGEGRKAYAWPRVAFAAPKDKFTLYVMGGTPDLADILARLGKHKMRGGCLYINRLSDIDESVLREAITLSYAVSRAGHSD